MSRPAPSRDSSLLSLSRSLRLAAALPRLDGPSPDSHGTGATRSSEVPGEATRSLHRSVAGRSDLGGLSEVGKGRESEGSWSEVGGSGGGAEFVVPCGAGEGEAFSEVSGGGGGASQGESRVEEASKASKRYSAITASQEEEGLYRSVTRSQSDFSKWLEDTM